MHKISMFVKMLDIVQLHQRGDQPVHQGAKDRDQEQLELPHILCTHAFANEDTVVIVIHDTTFAL